jgi:hypothetical protein
MSKQNEKNKIYKKQALEQLNKMKKNIKNID